MLQKLNELGYEVLPHLPHSPDLSPTDYHFFNYLNNFLQGKRFHNQQNAENGFQEFTESWNMHFYVKGIDKLISHCKNVLIVVALILINKHVFEPSYNDLKIYSLKPQLLFNQLLMYLYNGALFNYKNIEVVIHIITWMTL